MATERSLEEMIALVEPLKHDDSVAAPFVKQLIAKFRSPVQGELPPLDIIKEDRERSYSENSGWDTTLFCRERQLRAAYAEFERLKTCGMIELMLANPNADSFVREKEAEIKRLKVELCAFDSIIDEMGIAESCINPKEDLRIAITKLKQRAATSHASGKQEGRKECLEAVRGINTQHRSSLIWKSDAEQAILALPKVGE